MAQSIKRSIVGWAYFPNEDEFMEKNKDLIYGKQEMKTNDQEKWI